jgi:hypothetical protein
VAEDKPTAEPLTQEDREEIARLSPCTLGPAPHSEHTQPIVHGDDTGWWTCDGTGKPVDPAAVAARMLEEKRALVGMNSTVLDPEPSQRTYDTALILGALHDAEGVVKHLLALGMNPGGGTHSDLLRRLQRAQERIGDRIRQDPDVDSGECPYCHRRVPRTAPRSSYLAIHVTVNEDGTPGTFCRG